MHWMWTLSTLCVRLLKRYKVMGHFACRSCLLHAKCSITFTASGIVRAPLLMVSFALEDTEPDGFFSVTPYSPACAAAAVVIFRVARPCPFSNDVTITCENRGTFESTLPLTHSWYAAQCSVQTNMQLAASSVVQWLESTWRYEYVQCTADSRGRAYLRVRRERLLVLCPLHVDRLGGRLHGYDELHRFALLDARVLQRRRKLRHWHLRRQTLRCHHNVQEMRMRKRSVARETRHRRRGRVEVEQRRPVSDRSEEESAKGQRWAIEKAMPEAWVRVGEGGRWPDLVSN